MTKYFRKKNGQAVSAVENRPQEDMAKGARKKNGQAFSLSAPSASSVLLVGDFTEWEQHPIRLEKQRNGQWTATVNLPPGTYRYRFLVDGEWQDDPDCAVREANAFGTQDCVCKVG